MRRPGRDAGKLVRAELALDRWLSRLTRAAREVRRWGKKVKYYRSKCAFVAEKADNFGGLDRGETGRQ